MIQLQNDFNSEDFGSLSQKPEITEFYSVYKTNDPLGILDKYTCTLLEHSIKVHNF